MDGMIEYNVDLFKDDKDIKMIFKIKDKSFFIDMINENQEEMKKLFYAIVENSFSESFSFKLNTNKVDFSNDLFWEIADEYLTHLNSEIVSIISDKPKI
ncbi:MAG: hypothetical protein R3Y05_06415 [bacterium]